MTSWVCIDVLAVKLGRAESEDTRPGSSYVLNHDVQMELLGNGRVWPRRGLVISRELKCQA